LHLIINVSIDENWYLYGQEIPDGGPIPTFFHIDESEHFELIGGMEDLKSPEIKFDPFFNMDLPLFSNKAGFRQKVKILTDKEFKITGFVEFMSCDDERCLPPQEREFEYLVNTGAVASVALQNLKREQIVVFSDDAGDAADSRSLWIFFFIAFAGGLAGLLTPCVFPMIPMTVSFFMQKQSGRLNSVINAFIFGLSIIAVYTSLGLLVSLTSVGAGFANQLTSHWIPNLIFFLLFVAFAASFFGLFEIVLPGSLATKADRKAEGGGYIGSFFMALTLVIVSLSCVGPIVGALLVEAASGGGSTSSWNVRVFPCFCNTIHSPGHIPFMDQQASQIRRMAQFSQGRAWIHCACIQSQVFAYHRPGLPVWNSYQGYIPGNMDSYFFSSGMYLLGKIKFAHDSDLPHIGVPRLFFAIAVFSFVVYLIPGMFGAPLKSISSLLPARHTHSFDISCHDK
jgi:cytochrome c biogenesis protein CcdA